MKNVTVVFDLDGTLVDTAPDLLAATNHVLASVDAPPVAMEGLRPTISFGARAMIEHGLKLAGQERSAAEVDALLDAFLEHYAQNIAVSSRPYPGAQIVLESLIEVGARLSICTNKREGLSRKLLTELKLLDHFHAIAGRDTLPVCKPDPGHLIGAIILADGNPNRAVMIGDSETDIQTAKTAGIPVIAVTFGYSARPIAEYEPDALADSYGELHQELSRIVATL